MMRRLAPRPSSGGSKEPTVPSILPNSMIRTLSAQSVLVDTSDLSSFNIAVEISNWFITHSVGKQPRLDEQQSNLQYHRR